MTPSWNEEYGDHDQLSLGLLIKMAWEWSIFLKAMKVICLHGNHKISLALLRFIMFSNYIHCGNRVLGYQNLDGFIGVKCTLANLAYLIEYVWNINRQLWLYFHSEATDIFNWRLIDLSYFHNSVLLEMRIEIALSLFISWHDENVILYEQPDLLLVDMANFLRLVFHKSHDHL